MKENKNNWESSADISKELLKRVESEVRRIDESISQEKYF